MLVHAVRHVYTNVLITVTKHHRHRIIMHLNSLCRGQRKGWSFSEVLANRFYVSEPKPSKTISLPPHAWRHQSVKRLRRTPIPSFFHVHPSTFFRGFWTPELNWTLVFTQPWKQRNDDSSGVNAKRRCASLPVCSRPALASPPPPAFEISVSLWRTYRSLCGRGSL